MNNIEIMNFWIESSDEDYATMKLLFENHKNSWCLFIGHLVIEKLLKAVYAKGHKGEPYAPRSHDLLYLAERMGLEIDERHADLLDIITKFNMSARYGDF